MPLARMGPLQKGTRGSQEFAVYGFAGLNVKDVPQQVADTDFTVAYNGYLTVSGGFRMRNGMNARRSLLTGSGPIMGTARFFQGVKAGAAVNPPTTILLAQVGNNLRNADNDTLIGAINSGGTSAQPMTYVRASDPNDSNTGYSGGQNDVIVICTGSGGPYIFDGTNLYTPTGWANAAGAQWCALVNGVVYFGGLPKDPRGIYGTGDGISDSFESLPAYNYFKMSYPVMGLCAYGTGASAALVVGMSSGISTIAGTGPSNYVIQDVPSFYDGVMAGRAMVFDSGTVYFLGRQAVYAFDGLNPPAQISQKVEPWILNDPTVPGYPMTASRNLSFAFIQSNRLYIGYCSGSTAPNTLLVFDLIQRGWTVVQTTPGIYCACALDAPTDSSPAQFVVGDSTQPQLYNWDVSPDAGGNATDAGQPIIATCQTKFFKVGAPGTLKMLTRVYPELFLAGTFNGNLTVTSDYGSSESTLRIPAQSTPSGAQWDVASFDESYFSSGSRFTPFGAPATRIDIDELQAESYAFGISTNQSCAPWVFAGLTGVFKQLGRVGLS